MDTSEHRRASTQGLIDSKAIPVCTDISLGRLLVETLKSGDEHRVAAIVAARENVYPELTERHSWQTLLATGMHEIPNATLQQSVLDFPASWFTCKPSALYVLLSANIGHLHTAPLQKRLIERSDVRQKSLAMFRLVGFCMSQVHTIDLQRDVLDLPAEKFTDKGLALFHLVSNDLDDLPLSLQTEILEYPATQFADAKGYHGVMRKKHACNSRTEKSTELHTPLNTPW
jgi:hypothetical protein